MKNSLDISSFEARHNLGFGIYIHWPFCTSKCPYCDFNSHTALNIEESLWLTAYKNEIERTSKLTGPRLLQSIFIGGGTPSLMSSALVGGILDKIFQLWDMDENCEITLEANPSSVETKKFKAFKAAGVNRISMGIQSLNDNHLKRLGRLHTASEALASFEIARNIFEKTSFDLIYALQDQSIESWESELKQALSLSLEHMSLYQLTIEPGTAFGERYASGRLRGLPSDDYASDLFDTTSILCEAHGLPAYEVSNHAQRGSECRHNLNYWNYGDYAGIGPGAHGRLTLDGVRYSTETYRQPSQWLSEVSKGCGESLANPLSDWDQGVEMVLMGMRLKKGISLQRFLTLFGKPVAPDVIFNLKKDDLIIIEGGHLRTTHKGTRVLNYVVNEILPDTTLI